MAIVLPAERDLAVGERDEPAVGDGHPMRVAPEVVEDPLRPAKRRLGVDHPVGPDRRRDIPGEGSGVLQLGQGVVELERARREGLLQHRQEPPAEQPRQHPHGQEEARPAGDPALAIRREAPARHHTVQMRMVQQVLAPGVQDRDEADLGAQMPGVGGDRAQRLGGRTKQQVVDHRLVLVGDGGDLLGQREDHMEILDRQELGAPILQPLRPRERLAFWAMTVTAAVERDALVAASHIIAGVERLAIDQDATAVATVGRLAIAPNIINTMPGEAVFSVDFRHRDPAVLEHQVRNLENLVERVCAERGVNGTVNRFWTSEPTPFAPEVVSAVRDAVTTLDRPWILL